MVITTVSPPLDTAPNSVYTSPRSIVIVAAPLIITIGFGVFVTMTVLTTLDSFPLTSVALYVILNVCSDDVSILDTTFPDESVITDVTVSPPSEVAPASV